MISAGAAARAPGFVYNRPVASGKARSSATPDFHVGSWLVQPTLNLIRDGDTVRHLEPQVMDLLVFLATSGGRVVSKDEIIDAVWDGRFIAEATLTRSIADLRRALGDNQRRPAVHRDDSEARLPARRGGGRGGRPSTVRRRCRAMPEAAVRRSSPVVLPFTRAADQCG